MKEKIEYVEIKSYSDEKARIKVYAPILTEEERARRMKELHRAAADILRKD